MIKFFRKIRQRLLAQNKFSRYLLYAFGEIILVVIGILIALQINNWNEVQKTVRWEERFLTDLQNELNNDLRQLTRVIELQTKRRDNSQKVLDLIQSAEQPDKPLIDSVYTVSQTSNMTFFPTTGVYDSGMSAGKIENIRNDSLKYAIMNLYNHFYDRLVYNGEILDRVVGTVDWEKRKYFDTSKGEISSWEILAEPEFSAQIQYLINQNLVYTRIAEQNLERIENVIGTIDAALSEYQSHD